MWGHLLQATEIIWRSAVATSGSTEVEKQLLGCGGAAAFSAAGSPQAHLLT